MNILDKILKNKREEVARLVRQNDCSLGPYTERGVISFKNALQNSSTGIIAEFKRKSPSKGWISPYADCQAIIGSYEKSGATALSVLTDSLFFGGDCQDLISVRPLVNLPLLRKDFLIDPIQVYQSKAIGADVILLIAAALSKEQVRSMAGLAHQLGLEVLLEIHSNDELDHLCTEIDVVGVNNRNLITFDTSVDISFELAEKISENFLKISESGLSEPKIVKSLRKAGFQGFLMGEHFMKEESPGEALNQFIMDMS
ncbi:MAG: indole-3-glycerol phosphate synthase TrpC [Bacteroidales bacterium]|jgi:indole-3-glycerol phosphate synthase